MCCVSFGATGWIGALGVAPEARRHGVGTRAHRGGGATGCTQRGADTVLLFATDMGRPLYERLGFVIEGAATAWRGTAGTIPTGVQVRRLREDDRAAVSHARPRGHRRGARQPARRAAPARGRRRRALGTSSSAGRPRRPTAPGIAICADDDEAGVALMAAAASGPAPATLVVPDANAAAMANLRRWGFRAANAGERMRLGPPVAWRPERQFGLFNLFWG